MFKKLEKALGYSFKDKELLKQALTRQKALEESVDGAAKITYQSLEFVGDAALKHHLAVIMYQKLGSTASPGALHRTVETLIGNKDILPQVAKDIALDGYIIKGPSEGVITDKMRADALEAILGAIDIDTQADKKGKALRAVIDKLWQRYYAAAIASAAVTTRIEVEPKITTETEAAGGSYRGGGGGGCAGIRFFSEPARTPVTLALESKTAESISVASAKVPAPVVKKVRALSPTSAGKRLFALGASADSYQLFLDQVRDVNVQNEGKKGDTPLMALIRRGKIRGDKEIPKIRALIAHGARWDVKNRKGESAEDLRKLLPEVSEKLRTFGI